MYAVAEMAGVRKRFGNVAALDDVSLEIRSGELLAILGPNGAGKSTSIALLLGLLQPGAGSVTLFGQSPHSVEARQRVGVMMQDVNLPDFRVRELIELTASYYPAPLDVDAVLELTQITSLANRPYSKLSGGQKRLAQFAIAMCGRPQLLFLDEPTAGLDIKARETMWATLRKLVAEGTSIVLTTHYLEEAEALADRVIVLARGRIVATGSVNDIRALVARKKISCITALTPAQVSMWPGVESAQLDRQRLEITVGEAEKIVLQLLISDSGVKELEVTRAGLAEAFAELTQETVK